MSSGNGTGGRGRLGREVEEIEGRSIKGTGASVEEGKLRGEDLTRRKPVHDACKRNRVGPGR